MSSTSGEKTPSHQDPPPAYSQSPPANGGVQQQPYPTNGMQSSPQQNYNPQYQQQYYYNQPVQYSAVQPNQVQPYQPNGQAPAGRFGYSGPNYCCCEITIGTRIMAGVLMGLVLISLLAALAMDERLMPARIVIAALCVLSWALLLTGAIIYNKWMCIVSQVLLWCLLIIQCIMVFLVPESYGPGYYYNVADDYLVAASFILGTLFQVYFTLVVYCFVKYINFRNATRTTAVPQ